VETDVNPLKRGANISSNDGLWTGIAGGPLSVTPVVAAIPFRTASRRTGTFVQVRLGRVPPHGCRHGNWRNITMRMAHQETRGNSETVHAEAGASNSSQTPISGLNSASFIASMPMPTAPAPSPLSELDQWVSAERLLEILWDEQSRPSLQWIRKETKRRMLPHIRRGRLIFYRPRSVMEWFNQRECRPNSMK